MFGCTGLATTRSVRLAERRLDCETTVYGGAADETLVLLHAIGLDRHVWSAVAGWFPDGIKVVAVDLRGFGSASHTSPVSMDNHAEDLLAILDEFGVARAHVAGVSYGGAVAATFAALYPGRTRSVGLVAAALEGQNPVYEERAISAEKHGAESYVEPTIARWFTGEECLHRGRAVQYVETCLRRTPVTSWAQGWRVLHSQRSVDSLSHIAAPTAVIAGEYDAACPPSSLRDAADRIGGGSFSVVAGASHMLPLEQPYTVARLLYANIVRASSVSPC